MWAAVAVNTPRSRLCRTESRPSAAQEGL